MTREEAKEEIGWNRFNDTTDDDLELIDKIYGDFEKEKSELAEKLLELSTKYSDKVDEVIELKSRTCESCKYNTYQSEYKHNCDHYDVFDFYEGDYLIPYDFCCNKWEAKDAK